ncbi:hypothetical protein ABD76_18315 [Paenibacillus dendritiformis]|uniref:GtrA family protein n=1 Tax=Paenibacillus dendritiformis TaxID=130049 RepID=UPI002A17E364|nr:hypothetical protein [Paenibacillus dendritiformis]
MNTQSRIRIIKVFKKFNQFIKYGLVGIVGTVIHTGTLVVLVEYCSMSPYLASIMGFTLSLIISYFINLKWTFNNNNLSTFFKYITVSLSGLCLNMLTMYIFVHLFSIWYLVAQIVTVIIVPISNFTFNKYWTFKKKQYTN